ncbi:endonuclease/exonuclease/phosphatase family protein [Rhodopirellula sp. JC639]|uniref:endonuclease/exonuclease/phosphatase family protein n=1 Tax=Stieleria mannarensis TaxID=2755585 RepID=UPI001601DC23|nr:endonuclease/exonuclease/phosphatase family protein [Rhodopirellula sp. JC639]
MNLPWRSWGGASESDLCVLSYNLHRCRVDQRRFSELLEEQQPDVIAFQEYAGYRRHEWWQPDETWYSARRGELMVVSRFPIKRVEISFSRWPPDQRPFLNAMYCVLETPQGELGFCNLHIDTPRRALGAVLDRERIIKFENAGYADYRLKCRQLESKELRQWLSSFPGPKLIAGDFNMPTDSLIYRDDWNAFRNSFGWAGWGLGFTKQTVIRQHEYGLRIDHVLTDDHSTPLKCWVGPDLGSDHLPLFAEIARRD